MRLRNTQLGDAGLEQIGGLTGLVLLDLRNTQVSDAGLLHLGELGDLVTLYLDGTQVTNEGVQELQSRLPDCDIVYWRPVE